MKHQGTFVAQSNWKQKVCQTLYLGLQRGLLILYQNYVTKSELVNR